MSKFKENGHDSKNNWKLVNEITSNNSNSNKTPEVLLVNNVAITDPLHISESFNNYFVNVTSNLKENIVIPDIFPYNKTYSNSLFLNPISALELCHIVDSLENKTSQDLHNLSNLLVKKIFVYIVDALVHIFNLSLIYGVFPDKLKYAVVIPWFKSGNKQLCENFRPISILPIFSKVFRKGNEKPID